MALLPTQVNNLFGMFGGSPARLGVYQYRIELEFVLGYVSLDTKMLSDEMRDAIIKRSIVSDSLRSLKTELTPGEFRSMAHSMVQHTQLTYFDFSIKRRGSDTIAWEPIANIIRTNPLHTLRLGSNSTPECIRDAIANHRSMRELYLTSPASSDDMKHILETNRKLEHVLWGKRTDLTLLDAEEKSLLEAVRNNWAIRVFKMMPMELTFKVEEILDGRADPEDIHIATTDIVTGLLSQHLCAYEILWIIDWLPPMSTRYAWAPDGVNVDYSYDPCHGKKIALIEGLMRSYRRAIEARG
jgi:hypothetical protein